MKEKTKGFTLVELLAVIVILALIGLIATPIILNVIKNSQIEAYKESAKGYTDAVEKTIISKKLKDETYEYDGNYNITKNKITKGDSRLTINVKGKLPDSGNLTINNKGVTSGTFNYGDYTVTLSDNNYTVATLNSSNSSTTSSDQGATITLTFSGSQTLTCNSANNFSQLKLSSKTADSDDIFSYSSGGVVINKTGYYSVSTYAYLTGKGWINIDIAKNNDMISFQSFISTSSTSADNPGISTSYIGKFNKGDVIKQAYWCSSEYKINYTNLGVTYLHS